MCWITFSFYIFTQCALYLRQAAAGVCVLTADLLFSSERSTGYLEKELSSGGGGRQEIGLNTFQKSKTGFAQQPAESNPKKERVAFAVCPPRKK
jgi:hypothetical protein